MYVKMPTEVDIGSLEFMIESIVRRLGFNNCLIKIPLFIFYSKNLSHFLSVSRVQFIPAGPSFAIILP